MKSTVEEIRRRFDQDVDRFSNIETGQSATIDAPLAMELIGRAAAAVNPRATHALDVGCGAGNYALRLLQELPALNIDLIDLSQPMLARAAERIAAISSADVNAYQADIRKIDLEPDRYDIIVAAATLHHLRDDSEWEKVFAKLHGALKPGGSLWISDMVEHSIPAVDALMWERYGRYLEELRDAAYRDHVLGYIEKEDTPRSLLYQLDLMRAVGFQTVDVLMKSSNFAAFGGMK